MRSGIKMKYLVPALALLVLCTGLLSLGDSQARTQTGVIWTGQLDTLQTELTGEYLLSDGQRILMDDMSVNTSRQIPMDITAASGSTNGSLSCSVSYADIYGAVLSPKQAYMHAELSTYSTFVSVYEPKTVTLTLTPTAYAREARGYEVVVTTTVVWTSSGGSTHSADFITVLPTVEPGDAPDSGETEPDGTTAATAGTTGETEENTESTETQETAEPTEAKETTAPTTQPTQPTETELSAEESSAATEPVAAGDAQTDLQPDAQTDPAVAIVSDAEASVEEPATEPTEETVHVPVPTEPVTVTASQSFSVSGMSVFDPNGVLAVTVVLPTGSTGAKITMADGSALPPMTRWRIGSGKPTLLLDGGAIELKGREDGVYQLLLDLSATGLTWHEDVTVTPEADPTAESGTATEPVTSRVYRSISLQVTSLTTGETAVHTATASLTGVQRPKIAPILHNGNKLSIPAPANWGDCTFSYTLYRLETGESGTISYEIVDDPFAEGFILTNSSDIISISTDSPSPIPGTYRLTLTWSYRGLTIHKVQYPFFVNLSGYALY